jgi:2,4-dichlorophenol 6-monooxygenase
MQQLETTVLIVGAGPAGLTAALALSTYGIAATVITRHRWLAPTPRAHVTNQRTFELLRDLGVEADATALATPYALLPNAVFCTSLAGEELGRFEILGTSAARRGDYARASPCTHADLAQDLLEPVLLRHALLRGGHVRFDTDYLHCTQDEEGVTATVQDRLTKETYQIRASYLLGADGGGSKIVPELGLPLVGQMNLSDSVNIVFEADLTAHVAHRPALLYFLVRTGLDAGGMGLGFLRPLQRWHRWQFTKGYLLGQRNEQLTHAEAAALIRDYLGLPELAVHVTSIAPWLQNSLYATQYRQGRVFCMGDAVHRHSPSNGLGSNTSMQDAYNLAWKLALVLHDQAAPGLLDSYEAERVPIGQQVVERVDKSVAEYGPILAALGLFAEDPAQGAANLAARKDATPAASAQRIALQQALAHKQSYEFEAHGVELNQRYTSAAVVPDGVAPAPSSLDPELYYLPTTCPGARLPHAWVQQQNQAISTLDLVGHGRFTVLTGIGGEAWVAAAASVAAHFGLPVAAHLIGTGCAISDPYGTWAALREIADAGCLLVRPDGYIGWRAQSAPADAAAAAAALQQVLGQILGRPN